MNLMKLERGKVESNDKRTVTVSIQIRKGEAPNQLSPIEEKIRSIYSSNRPFTHPFHSLWVTKPNSDPEYYNKKIRRLKSKVRKEYNRSKLVAHSTEKPRQLSQKLLAAKKSAQEAFLKSTPSNEGKCWSDFYK